MNGSHRLYRVVETKDLTEEELQTILNDATDGLPEMQIDHVVGTKLILGFESGLNAIGRMAMKQEMSNSIADAMKTSGISNYNSTSKNNRY